MDLKKFRDSIVLAVIVLTQTADSGHVLMSAMFGEGSHYLAAAPVGESLVKLGHNVTFLIGKEYEYRSSEPKYAELFDFAIFNHSIPLEEVRDQMKLVNRMAFEKAGFQLFTLMKSFRQRMINDCDNILSDQDIMARLADVDAIIYDISFPCGLLIQMYLANNSDYANVPTIVFSPTIPASMLLRGSGAPFHPAYQPGIMTGYSNRMTFFQVVYNTLWTVMFTILGDNQLASFSHLIDKHNIHTNVSLTEVFRNGDLFLTNSDVSAEFPFVSGPNVISVGGLTTRPSEPVTSELEEFMQSSGNHGVVVFSLGTYLTSIKPEIVEIFARVFGRIPQKVIWQLRDKPNFELPANVKTLSWLPQNDLLGHPKTRVFMFQGGNNGFYEAIYHGVPIVVISFHGDQYDVAARTIARGLGRAIDKFDLTIETVYSTLHNVIQNSSYSITAKRTSAIFRDRSMRPADRAAFWVDHVMKYGGSYMRSPVHELSFIQYHLIDVLAFLTFVTLFIITIFFYFIRFTIRCCIRVCSGKSKPKRE